MPTYRRRHRRDAGEDDNGELTPTTEEILLDLRDPLPPGQLEWGMPTRCPQCEAWGYIDQLNLVDRVMLLHCPTCHAHWEISERQIDALNARHDDDGGDAQAGAAAGAPCPPMV
jgi:hypothetical protein